MTILHARLLVRLIVIYLQMMNIESARGGLSMLPVKEIDPPKSPKATARCDKRLALFPHLLVPDEPVVPLLGLLHLQLPRLQLLLVRERDAVDSLPRKMR